MPRRGLRAGGHLGYRGFGEAPILDGGDPRGGGDGVHRPGRLQRLDAPGVIADQTAEPQAGYREELGEGPRDPEPSVDHICDADPWTKSAKASSTTRMAPASTTRAATSSTTPRSSSSPVGLFGL